MADTNFRGPVFAMGSLEVQGGTSASIEPFDGPSGSYQGYAFLDPRGAPFPKDTQLPGAAQAWLVNSSFIVVDAVPQTESSTALAAAQSIATALVPLSLATVGVTVTNASSAWIAVGVPLIPQGTTVATTVIALDFGFTTGTTTASSSTVNVVDASLFTAGQWIIIGNVGNSTNTQSLVTQVQSAFVNATTITVSPSPAAALNAPIGGANLWSSGLLPPATQFGPSAPVATGHSPRLAAGMVRFANPREMLARNLQLAASTTVGGTATVLVTGYDVWGQYMTELLTANGTPAAFGKKGWKYILAATPQATGTANYTLGIGDVFSFPLRVDYVQQLEIWAGNTTITNNVGFLAAVTTPATNTTGDVRGTIQLSGIGGGTPISNVATSNSVLRLNITHNMSPMAVGLTTPNNLTPMLGTTQSIV